MRLFRAVNPVLCGGCDHNPITTGYQFEGSDAYFCGPCARFIQRDRTRGGHQVRCAKCQNPFTARSGNHRYCRPCRSRKDGYKANPYIGEIVKCG